MASTRLKMMRVYLALASAIETRYENAAMTESVDLAVFNGDANANEDIADIVGMQDGGHHRGDPDASQTANRLTKC